MKVSKKAGSVGAVADVQNLSRAAEPSQRRQQIHQNRQQGRKIGLAGRKGTIAAFLDDREFGLQKRVDLALERYVPLAQAWAK